MSRFILKAAFFFLSVLSFTTILAQEHMQVKGRYLYDANGDRVVLRGINEMFIWADDLTGEKIMQEIAKTGANVVRIVWLTESDSEKATPENLDRVISNCIAEGMFPMPELHGATGKWDKLQQQVDYWSRPDVVRVLKKHEPYLLLNIANECGDHSITAETFVDGYQKAIARIRSAGLKCPLVIDASGWGQDLDILLETGNKLISHDPLHNLLLSVHMWWPADDGSTDRIVKGMEKAVELDLPLLIGEFAPMGVGCKRAIDYKTIMAMAQKHQIGWLAWSWGAVKNGDCSQMDMTSEPARGSFAGLHGWGKEVAITDEYSIQNTSVKSSFLQKYSSYNPVKVIFDTDMGSDCDDAGALALLHVYQKQGKADIIGCIYSSGKVPYGAGVIEAINISYNKDDIPVGAAHDAEVGDPVDKMQAEKLAKDNAAFGNTIIHNKDAEQQTRLNRRLLVSQPDSSIIYITVGHTYGLYELLVSKPDDLSPLTGEELIKRKIKKWIALGALNALNPQEHVVKDWNFFFNGTAHYTGYLVDHFPSPAYFVDAGGDVFTAKGLKKLPSGNIVRTAYRDWLWNVEQKTLDDQRPSWDLATVYFAVEGTGVYLEEQKPGKLEFDPEKGCRWNKNEDNPLHSFIYQKKGVKLDFAQYLNRMIGTNPEEKYSF